MKQAKIKIGTRGSKLALVQSQLVVEAIHKVNPEIQCELIVMQTQGDKILDKPLLAFGGKGVFVEEFEERILSGDFDIAVHSAKDMPMNLPKGLNIIAALDRQDPRDVLITKDYNKFLQTKGCVVGTSSLRRQVQVMDLFPHVVCESLRGNVPTRLQKLEDGLYDGIILASAGIRRLGLDQVEKFQYHYFEVEEMIPASGQGIIAIEGRDNSPWSSLFQQITNQEAAHQLEMERYTLEQLGAGCHDPIGIYSEIHGDQVSLWMMSEKQGKVLKFRETGALLERYHLIDSMVAQMREDN